MAQSNFESGIRPMRIEYVAETTTGTAPANPTWVRYSDKPIEFRQRSLVDLFRNVGLGSADVQDFLPGPETHDFVVDYELQRAISADAINAGISRNADNQLTASHTIVAKMSRSTGALGADAGGIRLYYVGLGAWIGRAVLNLQTQSGEPIRTRAEYAAGKGRIYRVDQPSSATLIGINSTVAGDTTQAVRIESDGTPATVDQSATLNGTTYVSMGASTYATIDSISLNLETLGDVEVSINTGTDGAPVKGAVLATIRGKNYYAGAEGDLGIPPLGTGTHQAAIAATYEQFRASTLERPAATGLAFAVANAELTVDNNIQRIPVLGIRQEIQPGQRSITLTATVFGTTETHDKLDEHLGVVAASAVLTMPKSAITLTGSVVTDPGEARISGDATIQQNVTYESEGLTAT